MKSFLVLSSILALAAARPGLLLTQPIIATAPLLSQYHSQDSLGQYNYGYSGGLSAKNEVRSLDGVTRGSYSYLDAEGKLQTVAYSADALTGFRVAATNLPEAPIDTGVAPEPVKDTPEVVKARAEHLALVEKAEVAPLEPAVVEVKALEPVKDTEEVIKARAEHLEAIEKVKVAVPEEIKLEPVQETPEVALARSEHLKAVEIAKTRNAIQESIDKEPIKIISPVIAPHTVLPAGVRFALAEPTLKFEPAVQKLEVAKIEQPTLRFAQAPFAIASPYGLSYNGLVSPLTYAW